MYGQYTEMSFPQLKTEARYDELSTLNYLNIIFLFLDHLELSDSGPGESELKIFQVWPEGDRPETSGFPEIMIHF